jgi:hypothetical protein
MNRIKKDDRVRLFDRGPNTEGPVGFMISRCWNGFMDLRLRRVVVMIGMVSVCICVGVYRNALMVVGSSFTVNASQVMNDSKAL